jgi:predicted RNA-binding Zn-ribbon protein involved in translation (DUF1610 family)
MFEDYSKGLLREGIIEAKAGNASLARRYLERAIYASYNGEHALMSEAWFWLGQVLEDPAEKRTAFETALSHDLRHARARRALAVLDGKLKPGDVIDPDRLEATAQGPRTAEAQRFMCPKCGGRMAFEADGQSLVCEYCTRHQPLGGGRAQAGNQDFVIAMATRGGHGRPLQEQVFRCHGCGAQLVMGSRQMSVNCPYCGSAHVVQLEHSQDLLEPDGIVPHAFGGERAAALLETWLKSQGMQMERQPAAPRGVYLPLWLFEVGGVVDYTGERVELDEQGMRGHETKVVRVHDQMPVLPESVPVPASRKPSAVFIHLIQSFQLESIQAYDARYLADWPAELYDIAMADASLDARSHVYQHATRNLPAELGSVKLISTSSANLAIESFRLVLLPIWISEVWYGGQAHLVLINGQNGVVHGESPEGAGSAAKKGEHLLEWLGGLLDDL